MKKMILIVLPLVLAVLALPARAQRPLGIDVSSYQGNISWPKVYSQGVRFSFAKATEGTYYQDAYFAGNMVNGKAAGVQMGAYHYARPDLDAPASEASYLWNFSQGYLLHDGKTIDPALDLEVFNGYVGATSYADWANQWGTDLASDASAAGLSVHPCIYISACNACELDTSIALTPWIADWNGENLYIGNPWSTCTSCEVWGTGAWTFWQASDSGRVKGITGRVDLDTFNGTLAQLIASEGL